MIWESSFWKDDLLRKARSLARRSSQKRWPEASMAKVEQEVMLAFYAIRKLIEAEKLSTATAQQRLSVRRYPPTGKPVTKMNWHHLEELFDLGNPTTESRDIEFICNVFIHSLVFLLLKDEHDRGLVGFLVTSDKQRKKGLFEVPLHTVLGVLRQVARDYPNYSVRTGDDKTGEYKVYSEMREGSVDLDELGMTIPGYAVSPEDQSPTIRDGGSE